MMNSENTPGERRVYIKPTLLNLSPSHAATKYNPSLTESVTGYSGPGPGPTPGGMS